MGAGGCNHLLLRDLADRVGDNGRDQPATAIFQALVGHLQSPMILSAPRKFMRSGGRVDLAIRVLRVVLGM